MSILALSLFAIDPKNKLNATDKRLAGEDPAKMSLKELSSFVGTLHAHMKEAQRYDESLGRRVNKAYRDNADAEVAGQDRAKRLGITETDYLSVYANAKDDFKKMADSLNSDNRQDRYEIKKSAELIKSAKSAKTDREKRDILLDAARRMQREIRDDAALRDKASKIYDPTKR